MSQGPLERETCRDEVLPALAGAGWELDDIREQYPVKAGRALRLGRVSRDLGDGFVDYVLEVAQVPVAVVEAKRAYRSASDGVQQAVRYAQQLDVPLAYATNGAWGLPSRTRAERARGVRQRHHDELEERAELARQVLSRLFDIYADHGIDEVNSPERLRLPAIVALGSARDTARAFGGAESMHAAIDDLQAWIYAEDSAS